MFSTFILVGYGLGTCTASPQQPFWGEALQGGAVGTNNCHSDWGSIEGYLFSFPFLSFFPIFFSYTSAQKMFLSLRAEYSR